MFMTETTIDNKKRRRYFETIGAAYAYFRNMQSDGVEVTLTYIQDLRNDCRKGTKKRANTESDSPRGVIA